MAKYQITYSCGHADEKRLSGSYADRMKRISWYEKFWICPKCLAARHAKESAVAAEEASAAGLRELTGSKRQIAWAIAIRRDVLAKLSATAISDSDYAAIEFLAKNISSAVEWIDARDDFGKLLRKYASQK